MSKPAYYIVNGITFYRVIAAFIMLLLLYNQQFGLFKWLLAISFLTDAVDGYLARSFKVISKFGSTLDSIADDLTVAVAIIGIILFKPGFLMDEIILIAILSSLYVLQILLALIRYGKISSFHTYAAKIAAISQGIFLILFFFLPEPVYILFYFTAIITILDLAEEIILVIILPQWKTNIKGLYWVIKKEAIPEKQEY
jgi:CDP-diacylglycerol--glycerol-3-phosphate 3-phosphatidyltransferase